MYTIKQSMNISHTTNISITCTKNQENKTNIGPTWQSSKRQKLMQERQSQTRAFKCKSILSSILKRQSQTQALKCKRLYSGASLKESQTQPLKCKSWIHLQNQYYTHQAHARIINPGACSDMPDTQSCAKTPLLKWIYGTK